MRRLGLAHGTSPAPPHSHQADGKLPQFLLHISWPRSPLGALAAPCRTSPKKQSLTGGKQGGSLLLACITCISQWFKGKGVGGEALRGTTDCRMLSAAALSSTTRRKSTLPRLVVTNRRLILPSSPRSSMWLSAAGPDSHVLSHSKKEHQAVKRQTMLRGC